MSGRQKRADAPILIPFPFGSFFDRFAAQRRWRGRRSDIGELKVLFGFSLEPCALFYSGHRRQSYICVDGEQLVELRAHQRTYKGAYMRTALGVLGYSLTVLRLFDRHFYRGMRCFLPFLLFLLT